MLQELITPDKIILIAIFLLVGFPVHEFAHAFVAYRLGDATAKMFGRLTLNPVVHFDPIGGLFLVISVLASGFVFGWAKPTPVNPGNLRDRRNGEVLVSLAGPASNLIMAAVMAIVFRILFAASAVDVPDRSSGTSCSGSSSTTSRWRSSTSSRSRRSTARACCSASCRCATRGSCGRS